MIGHLVAPPLNFNDYFIIRNFDNFHSIDGTTLNRYFWNDNFFSLNQSKLLPDFSGLQIANKPKFYSHSSSQHKKRQQTKQNSEANSYIPWLYQCQRIGFNHQSNDVNVLDRVRSRERKSSDTQLCKEKEEADRAQYMKRKEK